jgi:homoserine kinase
MNTGAVVEFAVPGSTSNLGPGFDALSVAVDLHMRVSVCEVLADGPPGLELDYTGTRPPGENRIETAFRRAAERWGTPAVGVRAHVASSIPIAAGLGSSAAATLAGLRLYEMASGVARSDEELLSVATALEGHPDNAAAALLGGIVVSCVGDDGSVIARSWAWPPAVRFVVATPDVPLSTSEARRVLPSELPLRDAVANLQRAVLLVRALEECRYEDLREALKDRWHQPVRAALVPGLTDALAIDHPAVLGVCLSGAGPSVLALAAPGRAADAAAVLGDVYRRLGIPHTMRTLGAVAGPLSCPTLPIPEREGTA